jgi:hypothetical protein
MTLFLKSDVGEQPKRSRTPRLGTIPRTPCGITLMILCPLIMVEPLWC